MSVLPVGTSLGQLQLLETYDYYDGPRLFSARNVVGTTFFVLWADVTQDEDIWLYAPVSTERLADLREGVLSIREAFTHAEDRVVYRVHQSKTTGAARVDPLAASEIPMDCLPPERDAIDVPSIVPLALPEPHVEVEGAQWTRHRALQRIRIARTKGHLPPPLSAVTTILDSWVRLFEAVVRNLGSPAELLPISAVPGSFVVDMAISDPAAAHAAFRTLAELFRRRQPGGVLEKLIAEGKIPPASYRDLLDAVSTSEVDVRVSMGDDENEAEIVLEPSRSRTLLTPATKSARQRLQGAQIPQADEVTRVFRVLELASKGREITAEQLEVVPRQVAYYKHAGRVLGYLDEANEPTPSGIQLVRLTPEQRLISAAMHYEGTDCGGSWVTWSKVNSLAEVDPASAEDFLVDVSDLSESTAFRRAKTLRSWLQAVVPYHYSRWFKGPLKSG